MMHGRNVTQCGTSVCKILWLHWTNNMPRVGPGSCRIGHAPFLGRSSYEATNPGFRFFVFFCVYFVL